MIINSNIVNRDLGPLVSNFLFIQQYHIHTFQSISKFMSTPWKINMEQNHRGLEDHDPF